jgi:hypothetical protein
MSRENHYKKLQDDYEHCLKRMIDLFEYGRRREYELETAVANAHKYLGAIREKTDSTEIIEICDQLIPFLLECLNGEMIKKPKTMTTDEESKR